MGAHVQVRNDLHSGRLPPVQPFHAMAYPFSADLALAISSKYAQYCALTASCMRPPALTHPRVRPHANIAWCRVSAVDKSHLCAVDQFTVHSTTQNLNSLLWAVRIGAVRSTAAGVNKDAKEVNRAVSLMSKDRGSGIGYVAQ